MNFVPKTSQTAPASALKLVMGEWGQVSGGQATDNFYCSSEAQERGDGGEVVGEATGWSFQRSDMHNIME